MSSGSTRANSFFSGDERYSKVRGGPSPEDERVNGSRLQADLQKEYTRGTSTGELQPSGRCGEFGGKFPIIKNSKKLRILFVCSQNRWRSLTAQDLYRDFDSYEVRSAGTRRDARIKLSSELVAWADKIFVMDREHQRILRERFGEEVREKEIVCLKIPDEYEYMNPTLIEILKERLAPHIAVPD